MSTVAVIAHRKKVLGDGLPALRKALADAGIGDPIWHELAKTFRILSRNKMGLFGFFMIIFIILISFVGPLPVLPNHSMFQPATSSVVADPSVTGIVLCLSLRQRHCFVQKTGRIA